jgi:integrase/recombinase XerC
MPDPSASPTYLPAVIPAGAGPLDTSAAVRLVEAFLSGRKASTLLAYRKDLEAFASFAGAASLDAAAALLLARGPGAANSLVRPYKAHLLNRRLAPASINRRLAALRSLVKLGRLLGLVGWGLEVEGVKSEGYRDTRGPGREGFRQLLGQLAGRSDPKAVRDRAILRLLFDLALRRAEVTGLDLEDLDLDAGTLAVLGKGRHEKARLTLPAPTRSALASWVAVRGRESGPLFRSMDRAHKGDGRLTGGGVYRLVRGLGRKVGLRVRPHGLRHASISEALDLTGGDIRAVQKFSRHRDVRVLERYDDNRTDLAGGVARRVADAAAEPPRG